MAAVISPEGDLLLQGPGVGSLKKVPAVIAWARLLLAVLSVLLIVSSVLFILVWLPRQLLGTRSGMLSLWICPAIASTSIVAALVALQLGQSVAVERLGTFSIYSGAYWLFSWCFAAATLYATWNLLRLHSHRHEVNRLNWWYSLSVTAACLLVLGYLGYYGMIGLRTWAY